MPNDPLILIDFIALSVQKKMKQSHNCEREGKHV